MRKLALSAVAVAIAAATAGATYAEVNDQEELTQTPFTSGVLDLRLTNDDGSTLEPLSITDYAPNLDPADVEHYDIRVFNDGTEPGLLSYRVVGLADFENGCLEPETEAGDTTCASSRGELSRQVRVKVVWGDTCGVGSTSSNSTILSLSALSGGPYGNFVVPPGGSKCVRFNLPFPDDSSTHSAADDNRVQSDSATFRFRFDLVQA